MCIILNALWCSAELRPSAFSKERAYICSCRRSWSFCRLVDTLMEGEQGRKASYLILLDSSLMFRAQISPCLVLETLHGNHRRHSRIWSTLYKRLLACLDKQCICVFCDYRQPTIPVPAVESRRHCHWLCSQQVDTYNRVMDRIGMEMTLSSQIQKHRNRNESPNTNYEYN